MIRRNERASVSLPSFITICAIFRYVLRNNPKFMLLEYEVRKIDVEKRYSADIDVGFGKTIIAILLLAAFAVNGYQTVLMAPTQALAQQHYEEVKERTKDLGLNTVMLGGRGLKTKEIEY